MLRMCLLRVLQKDVEEGDGRTLLITGINFGTSEEAYVQCIARTPSYTYAHTPAHEPPA